MPCDTEHEQENAQLYIDVITGISLIRNNYPDLCNITIHTISLMDYLPPEGNLLCSQYVEDKVLYTYENSFTGGWSKFDIFIVTESITGNVLDISRYTKVIIWRTIILLS